MKMNLKCWLVLLLFSSVTTYSFAQDSTIITKEPKFKPPVVKTFLGVNQNGAMVTVAEGKQLAGLPLKIVDKNDSTYKIESYQFVYRQKGYKLDDETGKREVVYTMDADRFHSTPLPKVWSENIQSRLTSDEQLYFFDIVVLDKKGRRFFAPELKITIK